MTWADFSPLRWCSGVGTKGACSHCAQKACWEWMLQLLVVRDGMMRWHWRAICVLAWVIFTHRTLHHSLYCRPCLKWPGKINSRMANGLAWPVAWPEESKASWRLGWCLCGCGGCLQQYQEEGTHNGAIFLSGVHIQALNCGVLMLLCLHVLVVLRSGIGHPNRNRPTLPTP